MGSKSLNWNGHPILSDEDEHKLELDSAKYQFEHGMDREDAEREALRNYRKTTHAKAAAHHLAGFKASQASGNGEAAQKHHAMYSLHVRALGENPMGPIPNLVQVYFKNNDKPTYNFKGHGADSFLVKPIEKNEMSINGISTIGSVKEYIKELSKTEK